MKKSAFGFLLCMVAFATSAGEPMVAVDNFVRDADQAIQQQKMIVVLVTQPDCTSCEYVKAHHVEPMLSNGTFSDVAIIRELDLSGISFTDFSGNEVEPQTFALRYSANFSPSVLFLAPDGGELHKPIVGVSSRDYYGYYLEKAIKKSAEKIKD